MVKVVAILSPPERAARRKSGEWLVRACAICEHNSRRPRPALRMHAKSSTLLTHSVLGKDVSSCCTSLQRNLGN
ncbi:hypothetical protein OBBRIDRAFT_340861 [Obba rivulosa]|uniref:Uncharacterized protein n=1 Tax=Obba rivulosa TaxID=1052685 RepID=A0A8E2DFM6_9APHY|nr:hypothetical protein OBBRIDRAFT_340861 [Obba rivulosa]